MEKAWAILEKYIEWIAITIGGLLFMYALWTFWIRPDVNVLLGTSEVGPRNVDTTVRRGPGASLEAAINSPFVKVRTDIPDLPGEFTSDLQIAKYNPRPLRVPGFYLGASPVGRPDGTIPADFRVTEAPVLPPATVRKLATGRSLAEVPDGQAVAARDLAEVRVDFQIPMSAVAQAFREVRLPQVHQNTSVLRVRLMRQRQLADGSWGREEEVALLENNPLARMPLPPEGAEMGAKLGYVAFVEQNPQWLREPPFYAVSAGDDPMSLTVVIDAMPQGPASGPATQGGTQTNPNYQDDPRAGATPPAGQTPPAPQQPQPPVAPQANEPGQQAGGIGVFNAGNLQAPLPGWAWDVGASPGDTYRYRVIYALKNPMFNTKGIAATDKPELQTLLSLFSLADQTEWSPAITVEPLTYFYMTGVSSGQSQAKFTVFRWQNGGWQSQDFDVVPGDPIGLQAQGGIDYRTGRTLVDLRQDPGTNESYALLVDSEGRFIRRSVKDSADPKFKQLQDEVKANAGMAAR